MPIRTKWFFRQFQPLEGGAPPTSIELEELDTYRASLPDAQSTEYPRNSPTRDLQQSISGSIASLLASLSSIPLLATSQLSVNTWKVVVTFNIFVALVTLTVNASVPIWAASGHREHILYRGDCEMVDKVSLYAHAVINVLSTALLAASNHAMQILASPSRDDINFSHRQGRTFSIGIQSLGNLKSVTKFRATLWIILAISSTPLHLIYNSVIYPMKGANEYKVAVVTPDFLEGARFNLSSINNLTSSSSKHPFSNGILSFTLLPDGSDWRIPPVKPEDAQLLDSLRFKYRNGQLKHMTNDECIKTYLVNRQVTHRNLILVSDEAVSNSSSVIWLEDSAPLYYPTNWMCRYRNGVVNAWILDVTDPDCIPGLKSASPEDWAIGVYAEKLPTGNLKVGRHRIARCYVETVPSSCKLVYEPKLFAVVIAANAVKAIAMIATLLQYKRPALVNIGDALASFLQETDKTTERMCLATAAEFTSTSWDIQPRVYLEKMRALKRSTGASRQQWIATITMSVITMLVGVVLFASIYDKSNKLRWSLSGSDSKESVKIGVGLDTASLVVLANLPQVLLSLNYLMLNRLVTCMAVSREWSMLAQARKGLRTSTSRGEQRSTYWLQLPLRFAIPMMAISAGLHYLASQSLFFGSLRLYSRYDYNKVTEDYTGLGYAHKPANVLLGTLLLLNAAIVLWGKSYNKPGIPQGGFNSAVLSAACHPPAGETDVHLKPVQWGVVSPPDEGAGVGHCSFSSEEVSLPVEGQKYA